ncbi:pirin family protein [Montanilutibacter psychrotolerans]|uniref:Pirin family protein n=1 Tax=Montanilutibacter psychrotolerans TaxID=1327343 RepID=A0A3M8SKK2_9GAMM|nr:pirin family protein [Lysobacter psychrotolerans]RNF81719.1 pirin family protein [Lysobacter psychrotolerans]
MTTIITPRVHDLGGFQVRRAVPSVQARSVGPFVFVDHMGPALFEPDHGIDVRPHPHIGLATVTFLWAGTITHRDTLGSVQDIQPGDVNWMTAGRGIAHSERTPTLLRAGHHPLHGMQTWVALPRGDEEIAPEFHHHPAATLPQRRHAGSWLRVVAGRGYGEESPVRVFADTLFVAIDLDPDAELALDDSHVQRALYLLEGVAQLDGADLPVQHLVVLDPGTRPRLRARTAVKAMLLGGEPLDGHRHLWWNFVSSSKERIEQAKLDWEADSFGTIPGEHERIPLPGT